MANEVAVTRSVPYMGMVDGLMKPVYYRMQIIELIDKLEKDVLNALRMLRKAEDIANKETIRLSADDAQTMQTAIIEALKILNTLEAGLYEDY